MPSKDVGVDETKLVPSERYDEYFNSRIGLKRNPLKHQLVTEEVKQMILDGPNGDVRSEEEKL
jgi:hypothetical protein